MSFFCRYFNDSEKEIKTEFVYVSQHHLLDYLRLLSRHEHKVLEISFPTIPKIGKIPYTVALCSVVTSFFRHT